MKLSDNTFKMWYFPNRKLHGEKQLDNQSNFPDSRARPNKLVKAANFWIPQLFNSIMQLYDILSFRLQTIK